MPAASQLELGGFIKFIVELVQAELAVGFSSYLLSLMYALMKPQQGKDFSEILLGSFCTDFNVKKAAL